MSGYYSVVTFVLGEDENTSEYVEQKDKIEFIPRIGDLVSLWGTRDDDGNYVHQRPKLEAKGIVTKVEHTIEQRGTSHVDYSQIHFVTVFLMPIK